MTKPEFLEELATILNEDEEDVKLETELESLTGWDSVGLLGVIAMLDGDLGVAIDVDKLRECNTVQDLVNLAGDKLD
jgi:acyl carrier protein